MIAVVLHWNMPNSFWKASLISTVIILILSLLTIFVLQSNYLGFESGVTPKGNSAGIVVLVGGLVVFFGLITSLLVGYLLRELKLLDLKT